MDKVKVEAFLRDYGAVCEKHGLLIDGYDDGPFIVEISEHYDSLEEHIQFLKSHA